MLQEQLQHSAEHLLGIVEGKAKEIVGTTYAKLKELVTTIQDCGYFDQCVEETREEQSEEVKFLSFDRIHVIFNVYKKLHTP
jgi:caprin-1